MPSRTPALFRGSLRVALAGSFLLAAAGPGPARAQGPSSADPAAAKFIAANLRARAGIALDLGCGDASLAVALAKACPLTVRCVSDDEQSAERARAAIDAAGLYGTRIVVDTASVGRLAYPDRCATLVYFGDELVGGLAGRDLKEVVRVLSPRGVAMIGQGTAAAQRAGAARLTRPRLEGWLKDAGIERYEILEQGGLWAKIAGESADGWDQWPQRCHDAANTFGSTSSVPPGPFKLQWAGDCPPELASAGMLLADGREYVLGLTYPDQPTTTPSIHAFDAFTGVELWKRAGREQLPIDRSMAHYSPEKSCADMVAAGDSLYVLGGKFCHVFDGETGRETAKWPIPAKARPGEKDVWLYLAGEGDTLFAAVGPSPNTRPGNYGMFFRGMCKAVFALDRATGQVKWMVNAAVLTTSLAVGGGRVYFIDRARGLRAVDARSGAPLWANAGLRLGFVVLNSYYRDKLWLLHNNPGNWVEKGRQAKVFSAKTGEFCFEPEFNKFQIHMLSFANGQVYASPQHSGSPCHAADADTGKTLWTKRIGLGGCSPMIGTGETILARLRGGPGVIDLANRKEEAFTGLRPTCFFPSVPAFGMIYIPAPGCGCPHAFRANVALVPGSPPAPAPEGRLVKGEAFGQPVAAAGAPAWPAWRGDLAHSGVSREKAAAPMAQAWTATLPADATPAVLGYGLVFCGAADHKVRALDAADGKVRWQYIARGAVRLAPMLDGGRVYVGDDAGWAHCLRADDGRLIWRFRVAPAEDRVVGYGRLISRWRAGCGVAVADGVAYCLAGLFPEDRIAAVALDAASGEVKWEQLYPAGQLAASGSLALADGRLFVPSQWGPPRQITLDDPKHPNTSIGGYWGGGAGRGGHLMVVDKEVVVRMPYLEYTHHVGGYHRIDSALPVFTADAVYLRDGRTLTAERRDAMAISLGKVNSTSKPKRGQPDPALLWTAWAGEPMNAAVVAGDLVLTGGRGKVFAADKAGKELWNAAVGGEVRDLAFGDGRLVIVCDGGRIVCFKGR